MDGNRQKGVAQSKPIKIAVALKEMSAQRAADEGGGKQNRVRQVDNSEQQAGQK